MWCCVQVVYSINLTSNGRLDLQNNKLHLPISNKIVKSLDSEFLLLFLQEFIIYKKVFYDWRDVLLWKMMKYILFWLHVQSCVMSTAIRDSGIGVAKRRYGP